MIKIISCLDANNAIGFENDLLCYLKNDLNYFKSKTENSIVIQGRKTYESIINKLGKPLPNRTNLVLTSNLEYITEYDAYIYNSVDEVLHEYDEYGDEETDLICIGGGELYSLFLPLAETLYITKIHHTFDNVDAYFPDFIESDWEIVDQKFNKADKDNEYNHTFLTYKRKGESK